MILRELILFFTIPFTSLSVLDSQCFFYHFMMMSSLDDFYAQVFLNETLQTVREKNPSNPVVAVQRLNIHQKNLNSV